MKITDLKNYSVVAPASDPMLQQQHISDTIRSNSNKSFLGQAGDFLGGAVYGFSAPGRTIQNKVIDPLLKKTFGENAVTPGQATKGSFEKATGTDLNSTAAKVGEFTGETAQFAGAGASAGAATKGMSLVARSLAQGGAAGTVAVGNSGKIGKDEAVAAIFGSLSVPAGDAVSLAANNLSSKFPEWLVKPLLKQTKDAKVAGKDIAPFLVKSGRVGSVDSLIKQSQSAIDDISTQVESSLSKSTNAGTIIPRQNIVDGVVQQINDAGGAVSADDVIGIIDNLAPQARGILAKEQLTLVEANKLRSLIDKTLGDRAFVGSQLPFNKDVLRMFTNNLRETVKTEGDPALRSLFDDYSKNITLRNALVDRASSGGGVNSVGLYDLITGVGAYGFTGDPLTALTAATGRRVFESAAFKTTAAQVFKNTDKVANVLEKTSPETRAVILEFISQLNEGDSNFSQSQIEMQPQ